MSGCLKTVGYLLIFSLGLTFLCPTVYAYTSGGGQLLYDTLLLSGIALAPGILFLIAGSIMSKIEDENLKSKERDAKQRADEIEKKIMDKYLNR